MGLKLYIISFNPCNNPTRLILEFSPFYRYGKWGVERVTAQDQKSTCVADSRPCILNCDTVAHHLRKKEKPSGST